MAENGSFQALLVWLGAMFKAHPFICNGFQSTLFSILGFIISEAIKKHSSTVNLDWRELNVLFMINFLYRTPILVWFFKKLDKTSLTVTQKVFVDQFIFSPFFTTGTVIIHSLLHGSTWLELAGIVIEKVPKVMVSAWMFWIPQRYLAFNYISAEYRLPCSNCCALIWNVIFAYIVCNSTR